MLRQAQHEDFKIFLTLGLSKGEAASTVFVALDGRLKAGHGELGYYSAAVAALK